MKIGYIRVSTQEQNTIRQEVLMASLGVDEVYIDRMSGKSTNRPELQKMMEAFSRTNRLYGPEKPFGTIRYYRKPYTMQRNIEEAFKLYSGDRPLGLFADKLEHNLEKMNALYDDIERIFRSAGIENLLVMATGTGKTCNLLWRMEKMASTCCSQTSYMI